MAASASLAAHFVALLKNCAHRKDLCKGTRLHADILARGLISTNLHVASALVSLYARCGLPEKALQTLHELPVRDVVSWNALISAYAKQGRGEEAVYCFDWMLLEGLSPNVVTFTSILKAFGCLGAIDNGKQVHDEILSQGLLANNIVLGNALVDMYAKCGALINAFRVLIELPVRDIVSWNALIAGYVQHGQGKEALKCLKHMQNDNLSPDTVTFLCILKACGSIKALNKGKEIHDEILSRGLLGKDSMLGNALVDMYAKCGALLNAQLVLGQLTTRNIVSWSAMVAGYAREGQEEEALHCFERMQQDGISPNVGTFICALKACGNIRTVERGKEIHDEILRQGFLGQNIELGNALVDMYVKCNDLTTALEVLDKLSIRDVVTWSALIVGYAQQDHGEEALDCYERMKCEGLSPNAVTYTCILKACGSIGACGKGKQVHDEIVNQGWLAKDVVIGTALVDMYSRFSAFHKAQEVLDKLLVRDVVTWNALISGYAQQGQGEAALNCLECMQSDGVSPNATTFICVLTACSHSGLVAKGQIYFDKMMQDHGIAPSIKHHTCMVDLFGRAGDFEKAVSIIKKTPSASHDLAIWSALLGSCMKWENVELGRWAFEHAIYANRYGPEAYVCMANTYVAAGMLEDAKMFESMRLGNEAMHLNGIIKK